MQLVHKALIFARACQSPISKKKYLHIYTYRVLKNDETTLYQIIQGHPQSTRKMLKKKLSTDIILKMSFSTKVVEILRIG
jgi:hypothetical protein